MNAANFSGSLTLLQDYMTLRHSTSNIHRVEFSNLYFYFNVMVLKEALVMRHLVGLRRSME